MCPLSPICLRLSLTERFAKNLAVVASELRPPAVDGYHLIKRDYHRCGKYENQPSDRPTTLFCSEQVIGRYVYAFIEEYVITHLGLCEFEVYGKRK